LEANNILIMLLWLGELTFSSWLLSYGAEHLATRFGARFVGRTLLSVATTLPEIAIVVYAASAGSYGIALGAGLGSNILMMTLGLAIMLLIATTRLSKKPMKKINITSFKLDKIFLLITALVSAFLFIDGYDFIDGIVFTGLFLAYVFVAFYEMNIEKKKDKEEIVDEYVKTLEKVSLASNQKQLMKAGIIFIIGTIGIFFGAEPFIKSLEHVSIDIGVSAVILSVVISPIAGEMPEKISLMLLARKGAQGVSIAIANVLGSKILNNTLLLAFVVFGAIYHNGLGVTIDRTPILSQQMILATVITLFAVGLLFRKEIGIMTGLILLAMYIVSIGLQFYMSS
jgi:cation:H+ antiporter